MSALGQKLIAAASAHGLECASRHGDLCNCGAVHVYTVELSDADLLGRAVKGARSPGRQGKHWRWVAVMDVFALGSGYAQQLCRRFGLDPDEMVRA